MRIANSHPAAFQPDVILLDWQLPGGDGLEVLRGFKHNAEWASTPVIMFTAIQWPWHVKSARQAGACEVLEKPMDMDHWLKIPGEIENVLAFAA